MVKKKVQLHSSSGKCKSLPKPSASTSSSMPSTSSASTTTVLDGNPNSELAQKFELELCWCIQQLQNALKNGKLNPKQAEDQRKVLNTLMSSSAPIVKKRQVMRMTFGDYRAKMEAEQKKYQSQSFANRIKVQTAAPSKKSMFIKTVASGKDFRFNFSTPKDDVPDMSTITISEDQQKTDTENQDDSVNKFSFVPSKDEFKFNFVLTES